MTETKKYCISAGTKVPFHNNADFCVGTGRMGLALQKAYMEQLKLVQEKIGFKHIRGHGLFSDDMAIYHEYVNGEGKTVAEYNFTYLDMVMDNYKEVGLSPFLELGFMPEKLASGDQTIFYWKGNTTPPKSYEGWADLVQATLKHLMDRYGADEVVTWPIEVWNEPNLQGFWENADMEEYFRLFKCSFLAIKEIDQRFRVGGPAICGINDPLWLRSFLQFCRDNKLSADFVTRHHYTTKPPEQAGHYGYAELTPPDDGLDELKKSREIVDSFEEFKNSEIHITEYNTSYIPNCPIHDTNQNAAYIAYLLSKLGDVNESYSYWTFGDIFEENGVPFTPFHGGFGLVANGLIPKPTFWTFSFFKQLQGVCVHRSGDSVIVQKENGNYCGVAFNMSLKRTGKRLCLDFQLPAGSPGEYSLITKTVDETCCNPLKTWHDLGEPANPSKEQIAVIRESANPLIATRRLHADNNTIDLNLTLPENAVVYFEISGIQNKSDRGYSYERVMR
jgi:xylan 1,4-beta-xylosidase